MNVIRKTSAIKFNKLLAKVYLDANKEMDLYFETHNHSAVMFASMIFDEDLMEHEMSFLQLMNVYITIIDTVRIVFLAISQLAEDFSHFSW